MANSPQNDGHEELTLKNLQYLSTKDGEIYWKRKKLKTETVQHLVLAFWERVLAFLIVIGAITAPMVTYIAELESICKNTRNKAPFCSLSESLNEQTLQENHTGEASKK